MSARIVGVSFNMPIRLYTFKCKHCNKSRNTYNPDMIFCTPECEGKFKYYETMAPVSKMVAGQKSRLKSTLLFPCEACGKETSNKRFCSHECIALNRRKIGREETLEKTKEKFLEEKKRKGISFEELNRIAEWKRLHDDERWLKKFK